MRMTPRFFFYGHAAAFGGQIFRPERFDVDAGGASVLTVAGGASRIDIPGKRFGKNGYISFGGASTLAAGRFLDENEALAMTEHERLPCELRTGSTVVSEVRDIQVISPSPDEPSPALRVGLLSSVLTSTSPDASDEPSIQLGDKSDVRGVFIDDFELQVVLNKPLFQTRDTYSELMAACEDSDFIAEHGASLRPVDRADDDTLTPIAGGSMQRKCPPRPPSNRLRYATVVKELRWTDGTGPSYAEIKDHTVVVENFGTIFFGEILISAYSRRLTMLRLELGSPIGGSVASSGVGSNGGWAP